MTWQNLPWAEVLASYSAPMLLWSSVWDVTRNYTHSYMCSLESWQSEYVMAQLLHNRGEGKCTSLPSVSWVGSTKTHAHIPSEVSGRIQLQCTMVVTKLENIHLYYFSFFLACSLQTPLTIHASLLTNYGIHAVSS